MGSWSVKLWMTLGASLVVLLLGAALFGADGVTRHQKLREELDRINGLNEKLAADNGRLAARAKALRHDDAYIEQAIRDELGWVKPDEVVFIFPEGS